MVNFNWHQLVRYKILKNDQREVVRKKKVYSNKNVGKWLKYFYIVFVNRNI